jgi:hypothetical protein
MMRKTSGEMAVSDVVKKTIMIAEKPPGFETSIKRRGSLARSGPISREWLAFRLIDFSIVDHPLVF